MLTLLSSQIAISVENSLLFEHLKIEVLERTQAERSVRFLAEASVALAESLDYETILAKVARLAVPFLADWCAVEVLGPSGKPVAVAGVHADTTKEPLLRELREASPISPEPDWPSSIHLGTGQPIVEADIDEAILVARIPDAHHREIVRALGIRSRLSVPFVTHDGLRVP